MNNDTQPLIPEQAPEEAPHQVWPEPQNSQAAAWRAYQKAKEAWEASLRKRSEEDAKLLADFDHIDEKQAYKYEQEKKSAEQAGKDALEMMQEAYERIHVHGPFFWTMNQNHNALRGCVTCGQTWVGLMAGTENSLRWHEVEEVPEEEGE